MFNFISPFFLIYVYIKFIVIIIFFYTYCLKDTYLNKCATKKIERKNNAKHGFQKVPPDEYGNLLLI